MFIRACSSPIKKTSRSYFKEYYNYILDKDKEGLTTKEEHEIIERTTILDSSLITATFLDNGQKKYNIKVIYCGKYIYVYNYKDNKLIKDKNIEKKGEKEKELKKKIQNIKLIDTDNLKNIEEIEEEKEKKEEKEEKKPSLSKIEEKNLNRSKYNLQRLIKTNEDVFKTFITLTFEDDIKDIVSANKKFHIFITKVKSIYKDFKYVCVPEFQKNDRVHYHLLTNISYSNLKLINENNILYQFLSMNKKFCLVHKSYNHKFDTKIKFNDFDICLRYENNILQNTKKTYNFKGRSYKVFKTMKYWGYGFSSVISLKNINVVGYMTKYFTKDIDDRLFGFRRYFYSQNLDKPQVNYLDTNDIIDGINYDTLLNNYDVIFKKDYFNNYDSSIIEFKELKLNK